MNAFSGAISPYNELLSYETLWSRDGATLKKVSEYLEGITVPSKAQFNLEDLSRKDEIDSYLMNIERDFSILTAENYQYPIALQDPTHKIKLLYYQGDLGLLDAPKRISIVGARKATPNGEKRARRLAKILKEKEYIIVSGLAEGIDTAAMTETIRLGGKVIGVIGTPINQAYPKKNKQLQELVAREHLLLSHVPIYRYSKEPFQTKKFYFPQRNIIMAAVSDATIIVEASDTSGTLTQARACINMGRKLFILNSCFEQPNLSWPHKFLEKGAIRVRDESDIWDNL